MVPVFAIDNPKFVIVGAVFACWALLISGLGVMRHNFPVKQGAERAVTVISALLAIAAIGLGIAFAHSGPKASAELAKTKSGNEGSTAPKNAPTAVNPGAPSPGNGKKVPTGGASQTLTLSADPTGALRFNKTALQATAGNVKIVLSNPAPLAHNISIQGPGVSQQGPTVPKGGTSQVSVNLKPGKYTFYCSVPGHRQAGMQGTLTIK